MPDNGIADVAASYAQLFGWRVVPLDGKKPRGHDWNEREIPVHQISDVFRPGTNVGVVLGAASGGLVDVDLDFHGVDYRAGYALAERILPATAWRYGRQSKPNSHWFYRCAMPPLAVEQCKSSQGVLVELRSASDEHAAQTMVPGSTHPDSREIVEWDDACPLKDGPPYVDVGVLRRSVYRLAMASYIFTVFPSDGHEARMALCGWLAFQGWGEAEVSELIAAVMDARGHGTDDVGAVVGTTFHRLSTGEPIKGFPALKQILNLDKYMTGALRRWEVAARPEGAKPHGAGLVLTDYGVAGPIAFDCADDLRFCPEHGSWYVFAEKVWRIDDEHRSNGYVVEGLRKIRATLPPDGSEKERNAKVKALLGMETKGKTESILAFMESDLSVRADQFDGNPWLLNCQNGILDLKAGTIERHAPSRLQMGLAATEYDPTAGAPIFDKFIAEMFPDADVRKFVQRLLGYCLTGLTREHIFPIFHGVGSNGKSTLLGTVMDMLGTYARPVPAGVVTLSKFKADRHPTELASLYKRRLAVTSESEQGKRLDESAVKLLTGGDTFAVRKMYENLWDLRPTHKLLLMTNHVPHIWGTDDGIWRRLIFIPCEAQFLGARDNTQLREQLREEFSGILNWCIAGLKSYRAEGLSVPARLVQHAKEYREGQDEVLPFLEERFVVTHDHSQRVTSAELYIAYKAWCALNGVEPQGSKSLAPQYMRYGLRSYRTKSDRFWTGIRAKTKEESEAKS